MYNNNVSKELLQHWGKGIFLRLYVAFSFVNWTDLSPWSRAASGRFFDSQVHNKSFLITEGPLGSLFNLQTHTLITVCVLGVHGEQWQLMRDHLCSEDKLGAECCDRDVLVGWGDQAAGLDLCTHGSLSGYSYGWWVFFLSKEVLHHEIHLFVTFNYISKKTKEWMGQHIVFVVYTRHR